MLVPRVAKHVCSLKKHVCRLKKKVEDGTKLANKLANTFILRRTLRSFGVGVCVCVCVCACVRVGWYTVMFTDVMGLLLQLCPSQAGYRDVWIRRV